MKNTTSPNKLAKRIDCGIMQFILDDEDTYDIQISNQSVGLLELGMDNRYTLHYFITGGSYSGSGVADFTTEVGKLRIVAHMLRLLVQGIDATISDMEE